MAYCAAGMFSLFFINLFTNIFCFHRNLHLVSGIVKSTLKASVLADFSKLSEKKKRIEHIRFLERTEKATTRYQVLLNKCKEDLLRSNIVF